ncbi:MAG: molecular chaperone HtpG [Bacillota bacterium]|nr:molecular chaperone HtpG [Bacillota bacterium]
MKGNITIHTQNIFPIIKKWLYSDKDIFLRELVSNGCDAVTKMKKVKDAGAAIPDDEEYEIHVVVDKPNKTITVTDNGIGMTDSEIEKYITQVAFSGAEEFLNKYQDKDPSNQIIGHFGLGFFSAFMVSGNVEIESLSFAEGAKPAHWSCDGGTEYEMGEGTRAFRGTDVILHINDEDEEYLSISTIRGILDKYCSFLPVPIFCYQAGEDKGTMVNEVLPLWMKAPSQCTDDEYKNFYKKVFNRFDEPLFWIHLNTDYPFNLKGILYFPVVEKNPTNLVGGPVKLYNNQVFVADNIREIIPEFLLMLKGVIDCPDMPLNVSRSFLQNDKTVTKISDHIVKKVADKLTELFKNEKETYEKYWEDINGFVKYGCMSDPKFYTKVGDCLIFKTTLERYVTLKEYLGEDKKEVYYATSSDYQLQYLNMFSDQGIEVMLLPGLIDSTFVQFLEYKNEGIKFMSIDSVTPDSFKSQEEGADAEKVKAIFKKVLPEGALLDAQVLKNKEIPAFVMSNEYERRMKMMSQVMGGGMEFPENKTLLINLGNSLVGSLVNMEDEKAGIIAKQIYDLARLADQPLSALELNEFIKRSIESLSMLS